MDIPEARKHLAAGGLLCFPTETLWSLSCDALNHDAVARVFATKSRANQVPLAVGFASLDEASTYVDTRHATRLAEAFLPGPLTLVLPQLDDRLSHLAPGLDAIGVRIPDHPIAQALLQEGPLVMTSANRHGAPDARGPADVAHLGLPVVGDDIVAGLGSTVLRPEPWHIFREGAVSEAKLRPFRDTKTK